MLGGWREGVALHQVKPLVPVHADAEAVEKLGVDGRVAGVDNDAARGCVDGLARRFVLAGLE